ncbi:hypothetical protein DPMN_003139 [Dreissena polymorpha]|uniref:Uncharacterized protein n=1 Tax=Dreissena polymorpha TaxID=45954 RepID=A0A9D4MPD8_DREPO|nr:hypothetical protein DPMN_003139 [Dreissena polymorpha]
MFISPTVLLLFSGEHQHWYRVGPATEPVQHAGDPVNDDPFPPLTPNSSLLTCSLKGSASLNNSLLQEIHSSSSFHGLFSTSAMSWSSFPHSSLSEP